MQFTAPSERSGLFHRTKASGLGRSFEHLRRPLLLLACVLGPLSSHAGLQLSDTNPPAHTLRLFFIHHSTGENWLNDDYGGLGMALRANNYFVSDSNYGWGPESIGDTTDIGHWYRWFRSPEAPTYFAAGYAAADQNCSYTRLEPPPVGSNDIVLFKSCFPNSALQGALNEPIPTIADNPLKNQDAWSEYHTVANAKGIYLDLLNYFAANKNKLFVAVTAPPLSDATYADNARALNQWLVSDWLANYPHANVWVFDFYNVLTSNRGSPSASDVGLASGNHHRWWNGAVQHQIGTANNVSAYASAPDDDHPNAVGSRKATAEFVPLLNAAVNAWKASLPGTPSAPWLASPQLNGATMQLTISNLSPAFTYRLQRCTDLISGNWQDVAALLNCAITNWNEPVQPQAGGRFYRVIVP